MLIRPAAQPQATDDVAPTNHSKVAGRKGVTANFGERERPWTKVAPVTNEFTDPVLSHSEMKWSANDRFNT